MPSTRSPPPIWRPAYDDQKRFDNEISAERRTPSDYNNLANHAHEVMYFKGVKLAALSQLELLNGVVEQLRNGSAPEARPPNVFKREPALRIRE